MWPLPISWNFCQRCNGNAVMPNWKSIGAKTEPKVHQRMGNSHWNNRSNTRYRSVDNIDTFSVINMNAKCKPQSLSGTLHSQHCAFLSPVWRQRRFTSKDFVVEPFPLISGQLLPRALVSQICPVVWELSGRKKKPRYQGFAGREGGRWFRICGNPFHQLSSNSPFAIGRRQPIQWLGSIGAFWGWVAYHRVEGVTPMYIGAGNPPRSIQAQTGRWVNQNMSLNIISLILSHHGATADWAQ